MPLKLFPYQQEGAAFLVSKPRALLADEMGLGKTVQAITAAINVNAKRILVVCPAMVRSVWADVTVTQIWTGRDRPSGRVTVTSYELAAKKQAALQKWEPDVVIADEAHFMKSRTAKRSKAVVAIAKNAKHCWFLSGTPAPNHAGELYVMMRAMGAWDRDYWSFLTRYTTGFNSDYGYKPTGNRNVSELRQKLIEFSLRRKKSEVATQLPSLQFEDLSVDPGSLPRDVVQELDFYGPRIKHELARGSLKALDGHENSVATLRRMLGLLKVQPVADHVVEEIKAGRMYKVVIFGIHRAVLKGLRDVLRKHGLKPELVYGGTDPQQRTNAIEKFRTNPHCKVFIGNLTAAGTGITLTTAQHVLLVEPSWVPSDNAQAIMRVHRIGQNRPVTARFISIKGTIDEDVERTCRHKTQILKEVLD